MRYRHSPNCKKCAEQKDKGYGIYNIKGVNKEIADIVDKYFIGEPSDLKSVYYGMFNCFS